MADFEQKTAEYGKTTLKIIRVKEVVMGLPRNFGTFMISENHLKEQDNEMLLIRIKSLTYANKQYVNNLYSLKADNKLSINKLFVSVNHRSESVEFGPIQGFHMEEVLRDKGIGSYILNEIISWLKQHFPTYTVEPFEFFATDTTLTDDKERRNKFLENFGFNLQFTDIAQKSGSIKIERVALIKEYTNYDKIEELDMELYIFGLVQEKNKFEKDYSELRTDYQMRGEELLGGIPKPEIIKYSIIAAIVIFIIFIYLLT